MDERISDEIMECMSLLDESIDVLSDIEFDLNDEREDGLIPDMTLHHLLDMTEDVSENAKLKRAEMSFTRRQSENLL